MIPDDFFNEVPVQRTVLEVFMCTALVSLARGQADKQAFARDFMSSLHGMVDHLEGRMLDMQDEAAVQHAAKTFGAVRAYYDRLGAQVATQLSQAED